MHKLFDCEDIGGGITLVTFLDRKILDLEKIEIMGKQLCQLVEELGKNKILLNFEHVEFFSSAGLGKLIRLTQLVQKAGGRLVFCCIEKDILDVFKVTKLDKLFNIKSDLPGGIAVFG